MRKFPWINLLFVLSLFGVSCSKMTYRFEEGIAWNTLYHITYESDKDLSDSIISVLNEIDGSLSPFNKESTVSRINDCRTAIVDSHFAAVFKESKKINLESEGAFDPTLAPVIRAWGFGQGHEITADTLRLDSLMQLVGLNKTSLDGLELYKENPLIEFNFSALAKGYGVDCIADMLIRNGVDNYLVEVGGEIRASGTNKAEKNWTIGIDRPDFDSSPGDIVAEIVLTDSAIATSGNYRNYQEAEGTRFGHTISPATGRPVETEVISASVICSTCMEADALATACMVMGKEKALSLCTRLRAGVMLILRDMTVVTNPIWQASEPGTGVRD